MDTADARSAEGRSAVGRSTETKAGGMWDAALMASLASVCLFCQHFYGQLPDRDVERHKTRAPVLGPLLMHRAGRMVNMAVYDSRKSATTKRRTPDLSGD